ncbi:hypothetical protein [Sunxiuqinia elliptica]|uniref:NHL repeat-containing protein n=1 Tax=Sunxiuqinia elliptica TaxID=655355 RepID=A0A4R6GQF5_9BACT|nr:hypothetical protein [Sunxiuqinia elliptica]TDN96774.1 hypothetical protein DET52_111144 [Sunxiuqinia elliptica]TDO55667.1 hypothetical protein DET65_4205 [Sunxiuqinia elliptica]
MKFRKLVNIVLVVLALGIAIIIARDFVMNRAGKVIENPYAFDVSEYAKVSADEILYEEEKVLQLRVVEPKGIAFHQGTLFVIADSSLLQMNLQGQLLKETKMEASPTAIAVDDLVWLGMKNQVVCLNFDGQEVERWENYGDRSVITSLAVSPDFVFVADAGNRLVYQCKKNGELVRQIGEKNEQKAVPGFVVPSPYFDIALSEEGYLWAVNPGRHSLENFNAEGALRTSWTSSSVKTEGFSGCCNPAHMTMMSENAFVTSEKGIVRVKIYDQHGKYQGVVAAPNQFEEVAHAPDVCVDENGRVILLDFDRKQVRIFKPKERGNS